MAELVHVIVPKLRLLRISGRRSKLVAVGFLAIVISTGLTVGVLALVAFFRSDAGSLSTLLGHMADIIDQARGKLPGWIGDRLPRDAEALGVALQRTHTAPRGGLTHTNRTVRRRARHEAPIGRHRDS